MGLAALLFTHPFLFLILAVLLLYSVIAHEVAHGWVANRFGDDTAQRYGRLTLNPASHLDPLGTLRLFRGGFGWAKPVPVDFSRLRGARWGFVSVALAGCVTNIVIAAVALMLLQTDAVAGRPFFVLLLGILARINIILGAFNLIPIPPLDGSKILFSVLPPAGRQLFRQLEPYGFFILIALLYTGMLNPVIAAMQRLIYAAIALLTGGRG